MDPASENGLLGTFMDAAAGGSEIFFVIIIVGLILGVLMVGVLVLFNGPFGRSQSRRQSSERRAEERLRQHKDLVHRIRSFARSRQEAVAQGIETPEAAASALQHYGDGVLDTVTISTRNVKQVDRVRSLVAQEMSRLRQGVPGVTNTQDCQGT